jgi:SAM-dependent methyltransferase
MRELLREGLNAARTVKRLTLVAAKRLRPPPLPANPDGRTMVHLGCGEIVMPGYVNVDMLPLPHVHYVAPVGRLKMFADESVDLLYACHVLEHVPRRALPPTLAEWRRVLKPGGLLRVSVPDFDLLLGMRQFEDGDVSAILDPLMGSQSHRWDFHYCVYTAGYLGKLLADAGFSNVRPWDSSTVGYAAYGDWSSRSVKGRKKPHFISLNLEANR